IPSQDARVIGGLFARRIGVEMSADRFDLLGDGLGIAAVRSLEGHVFQQMGDAVDLGRLIARAHIGPAADRRGLHRIHAVGRDPEPIAEAGDLYAHAALPAPTCARIWVSTAPRSFARTVKRSSRR